MRKNTPFFVIAISAIAISLFVGHSPSQLEKQLTEKNIKENENHSVALDALQFLNAAAAFPNSTIPGDAYVKAMKWYNDNARNTHRAESSTSWISLGPTNMGGRTIAIAMDPTDTAKLWLGSASGGLWKSTTGGIGTNAWTYVPLGFPVLGVSSIAINPKNNQEMYVGTGEVYCDSSYSQGLVAIRPTRGSYGMGLFKSTDGGTTWTQSINWTYQQNRGIWDIVINPLNPKVVYAGTTEGVYKSTDAGATWNKVLNLAMCMTLQMHAVDTNILLCGIGNYGTTIHGVYRTTNSGGTWTQITSGLPASNTYKGRVQFTAYKNNNDTMFAHIADVYNSTGFYMSTDKGQTWTMRTTVDLVSYQGWYARGIAVQPGNYHNILVGGVNLSLSNDAGLSFQSMTDTSSFFHSDVHNILVNPQDPNKVYVITDGGLIRSNDFGVNYYMCVGGYNTTQSYIGAVSATDTTVMLSGFQDNYVVKYFGSQTWYPVIGGDGCYTAIDHTNDFTQYGAYQYLNVLQSFDQGNNFNNQILNNSGSATSPNYAAFLAPYILCYSNTNYIYAGGQALQLSTDGGATWNYMGNNPVNNNAYIMTIGASYTNTDSIYFATAPDSVNAMKVYFSANQGTTVTDISAGLPNRYPRRIAVNPQNSSEVYIVFSGFGTGHVFKSSNAGKTWTDISSSLPDMPFECIAVDPMYPSYLYAGCDFGVFVSPDKGATWMAYDAGFTDATMVFDIEVSNSTRSLFAFTHGRGMFKRDLSDLAEGVNNISAKNVSVNVFPNPASNEIHIGLTNMNGNDYSLSVFDIAGKKVMSASIKDATTTLPIDNLQTGAYFVNIYKDNVLYSSERFIKL